MYHPSQVNSEVGAGDIPPEESEAGTSGQGAFPIRAFVYQGDKGARMLSHNKVKVGDISRAMCFYFFPFSHFYITFVSKTIQTQIVTSWNLVTLPLYSVCPTNLVWVQFWYFPAIFSQFHTIVYFFLTANQLRWGTGWWWLGTTIARWPKFGEKTWKFTLLSLSFFWPHLLGGSGGGS